MPVRSKLALIAAAGALIVFAAPARAQSRGDGPPLAPAPEERSPTTADPPSPIAAAPSIAPAPEVARLPSSVAPASGSPKPRVPLAKRWWFWASLGTAAVGV